MANKQIVSETVRVLMERDGISQGEAEDRVEEVRQMILDSDLDYDEVEDIIASALGLEMDYIFDFL